MAYTGMTNAEYLAMWRRKNPEKHRATTRRQTLKEHGLTVEEYDQIFTDQGNACAACGCTKPRQGKWHVDHCHKTGVVRGILCQGCNHVLGHAEDSIDILLDVIGYLHAAPPDIQRQIEAQAGLSPSHEPASARPTQQTGASNGSSQR